MWDLIHDRTHMRGDLPFDPFMIKQRMPFFLYSLEELRCDLTAFRESVRLDATTASPRLAARAAACSTRSSSTGIFRFADHRLAGAQLRRPRRAAAVRLAAPAPRAALDRHARSPSTGTQVPDVVIALGEQIEELYWRSIDRPKIAHWLAAYEMLAPAR